LPIGAFTKSSNVASGFVEYRLAALQVSITLPPPTARNTSKLSAFAKSIHSLKLYHKITKIVLIASKLPAHIF
jgi:hypothetical protein